MFNCLRHREGQNLVLAALLMPVALAFMGLVLDVGFCYLQQRAAQNAADAGATAAIMTLANRQKDCGDSATKTAATNVATTYANLNVFTKKGAATIAVQCPPAAGKHANNNAYVRVVVTQSVQPIFAKLVWKGTITVSANATAGFQAVPLGADLIVLKDPTYNASDPSAPDMTKCQSTPATMTMVGNSGQLVVKGTVQVNSRCGNAMSTQNGHVTAKEVNVSGSSYSGKNISPTPNVNMPQIPDPLADLPAPNGANSHCITRGASPVKVNGKDTFLPGIYPTTPGKKDLGSVPFDGTADPTNHCNGAFIFQNGIDVSGNGNIRINHGMFYIASGPLSLAGNMTLAGTPPDKSLGANHIYDPYHGILVFMARNNTSSADFHGNTVTDGPTGMVYLPAGSFSCSGDSSANISLITGTFATNGGVSVSIMGANDDQKPHTYINGMVE